jgi:Na+/glutamate symporter
MSSTAQKNSEDKRKPSDMKSEQPTAFILFSTAADTTWRMFVPTLGGTLIGLWMDDQNGSEPLYGFMGLSVGIIVTALLVHQQYKRINEKN